MSAAARVDAGLVRTDGAARFGVPLPDAARGRPDVGVGAHPPLQSTRSREVAKTPNRDTVELTGPPMAQPTVSEAPGPHSTEGVARASARTHQLMSASRAAMEGLHRLTPGTLLLAFLLVGIALAEVLALTGCLLILRRVHLLLLLGTLGAGLAAAAPVCLALRRVLLRLHLQNANLLRLATLDELTGAPNRRVFLERLDEEVDRACRLGSRLCVVFIDVDLFKQINDQQGHHFGDAVLKELYARLEESLRVYDFTGRYGGDEFVLALPGTDADSGVVVAERIRRSVQASPLGRLAGVTISLGVAEVEDDETADRLLRNADRALYLAKSRGRNQTARYRA